MERQSFLWRICLQLYNFVYNSTDEIEVDLRQSMLQPLHGTWLVTTWQAVLESGALQKGGTKREYPNLFKGRQPYRLKIHLKTILRYHAEEEFEEFEEFAR